MKARQKVLLILLLIIGLAILFYPTISNQWNAMRDRSLENHYTDAVDKIDDTSIRKMWKAAQEYNKTLVGGTVPDAFASREHKPDKKYESLLDPNGDGMMGTVEIPAINIKLPVYHYTDDETLAKGAGHLPGSSLPVGGRSTHSVISAHRGLPSQKLFTDLDRVKVGNTFYLHILNRTLAYKVDKIDVVDPSDTAGLAIVEGRDYSTLLTCTPYGVNTQRLLVRGHRIPYSDKQFDNENKTTAAPNAIMVFIRVLCVLAGIAIALIVIRIYMIRNRMRLGRH